MDPALVLDVILVIVLVAALLHGFRLGILRVAGAVVGTVAGAVAAVFAIPLATAWIADPGWRLTTALGVGLVLVLLGYGLGALLGGFLARGVHRVRLGPLDRLLGAVANVVVAVLALSLLAFAASSTRMPVVAQAVASSSVLRTIDAVLPPTVESLLAQARSSIFSEGIPRILEAVGTPTESPEVPSAPGSTEALQRAAASVGRVSGHAPSCGRTSTGSGFVIAPERVLTNAHVVAGVERPLVELPGERPREAEVVYLDPADDLAVLAVPGLTTPPLAAGPTLAPESDGVVQGYPFGGPFTEGGARVLGVGPALAYDIYGAHPAPRSMYTLAARVQPGNSGGPFLGPDGVLAGVIFAKSDSTADVGYALTMEEVAPVLEGAAGFTEAVSSGRCP